MSMNLVDQTTGELTKVAGNATDKIGNLNALNTTDKSSAVAAINELDAYTKRVYGSVIDISSYDSSDNLYTVPADGMVVLAVNDITTGAEVSLMDADANLNMGMSIGNGTIQLVNSVMVIKGQRIYSRKINASNAAIYYRPLN